MHYKESLKPIFFLKKSSVHYNLEGFNTLFVVVIIEDKEILRGSQYSVKMFVTVTFILVLTSVFYVLRDTQCVFTILL